MAFLWRGLEARNLLRPLIFNFPFISLFLIILYGYRRTLDPKRLILLPVLGVFWVNLHLGSFVYGGAIIAAFLLGSVLEYAVERCRCRQPEGSPISGKLTQVSALFFVFFCYQACFLITPYGVDGFLFPFKVFLNPDFIQFYKFKRIISEMASPAGSLGSVSWVQFVLLAGMVAGSIYMGKKKDLVSVVLFAFGVFAFLQSMRAVTFFVLISVYIIAQCWIEGGWVGKEEHSPQSQRRLNILMVLVLLACGYMGVHSIASRGHDVPARAGKYAMPGDPQKAAAYLKDNALEGLVFADDHLGGYLIWSGYPRLRPFVDGRQLNQEYFQMYLDALDRPEVVWDSMERRFGFSAVIFDMNFSLSLKLINHITHSGRWRQAYRDRDMVVYIPQDAEGAPAR